MMNHLNEAYCVMNAFYQTAGVGVICFDRGLNIAGCRPDKSVANDFMCLGTGVVTGFLAQLFATAPGDKNVFYTYLLEANLACLIAPVITQGNYTGAFVTQPIFLNTHTPGETDTLIARLFPGMEQKETARNILHKVPVRSFEKFAAMGETIRGLIGSFFSGNAPTQVVCGELVPTPSDDIDGIIAERGPGAEITFPVRQLRFSDYMKLKGGIQSGDLHAVQEAAEEMINGNMPTHQLDRKNYIRSLKDTYIKICSMACYAAIEANAPYYKLLDLADELIRQAEKTENAVEIFALMKTTLAEFTRSVKVSRIQTHSKAVRQILDYIDAHFEEKITLEMLAEHTGLSTFYLSSLIKKETGLILTDNINAVRVEKSKILLLDKSINIIDVAHQVGFGYQNHFSTVFKKFTGLTPSEYVKSMGNAIESPGTESQGDRSVEIIADQMRKTLAALPEMYDAARIVDPRYNKSWALKNNTAELLPETCYAFWKREASCKNCVSTLAFLNNRTYLKLEQKGDSTFLVIAIPKTLGKKNYVVELLKKVNRDIFFNTDDERLNPSPAAARRDSLPEPEDKNLLFGRKEIDKKLPYCVRRSKLERKPFSIILCRFDDFADSGGYSPADLQRTLMSRYAAMQPLPLDFENSFSGQYTGDIVLLALEGADHALACRIAELIEADFENMLFDVNGKARFFNIYSSVKTVTEDVADANELINLALTELNLKVEDGLKAGEPHA